MLRLPLTAVTLLALAYGGYGFAEAQTRGEVAMQFDLATNVRDLLRLADVQHPIQVEGVAGTTPDAGSAASSSSIRTKKNAGEIRDEVTVRVRGENGREITPRFHFADGGARLVLDERHFRPGFYRMEVTHVDAQTRLATTAEQDLAWGVLSMNADQDRYRRGDVARLDFGVLDEKGNIVCDALLALRVTMPDGTQTALSTADGTIRVTGACGRKEPGLTEPDYTATLALPQTGEYTLVVTSQRPDSLDHTHSTITAPLLVEDAAPFVIRRSAATRLWPYAPSLMQVEVAFDTNFTGTVRDVVPQGFTVRDVSPAASVDTLPDGNDIAITWSGSWKKGEVARFAYSYDAPDVSPEFYLVGPLRLQNGRMVTDELRTWQIANDAASRTANYAIISDVVPAGGGDYAESSNYLLSDTIGEGPVGYGSTTNYILNAGYRQGGGAGVVGLACTSPANLGTISTTGRVTGDGACTVTTDNANGYALAWGVLTGSGGFNTGSLVSQYEETIHPFYLDGGLIAHWRMDETTAGTTLADASGNGRTGTPSGAGGSNNKPQPSETLPSNPNFQDVRSLDFDGTDDSVTVANLDMSTFTFAAWVKRGRSGQSSELDTIIDSVNNGGWGVGFLSDGSPNADRIYLTQTGMGHVLSSASISDTAWHHIAVVFDGSTASFYVDGILDSQQSYAPTFSAGSTYTIGSRAAASYFLGKLDDMRVYSRALGDQDIAALAGVPQSWDVPSDDAHWGARLKSTSDDTDLRWGTDNVSEKWLPVGDGAYTIVTRGTATPFAGSVERIEYSVEIGGAAVVPAGTYQATVTYTASAL